MKKLHILLIILTSLLLIAAVSYGLIHLYASRNTVPSGVTVGGIDVGGLSFEQAQARLQQEITRAENRVVLLQVPETTNSQAQEIEVKLNQAGIHYTTEKWNSAIQQLKEGPVWSRAAARWHLTKHWDMTVHWDKSALRNLLSPSWEARLFGEETSAKRVIDPDDSIRYIAEIPVMRLDWPSFEQKLKPVIPTNLVDGERSQLVTRVLVPLKLAKPAVTVDTLRLQGIKRRITQFATGFGASKAGRIHNIDAVARVIDGMLLAPGEIFDYAKVIDKAEAKYGFKPAPVIVQGKLVPGIGGGICQVSSTLYNAAVRAGLGILERRNHSLPVSYLPKGQDATFAKGFINFRFKNTTSHYILIKAAVNMDQLTLKLFGDIPENVRYELESRTVKVMPIPQKFVKNNTLALGVQQIVQEGKMGYIVETHRVKYVNGIATEKRLISRDTYQPQASIIAINMPGHTNTSPSSEKTKEPLIEDGVQGPVFQ